MSLKNSQSSIDKYVKIPTFVKGDKGGFVAAGFSLRKHKSIGIFLITIFLFGCAPQKDIIKQDVVADLSAIKEPVYITARGVGSPSFDLQKIQERRMSANRSSISAAVYQLISFLKGLRLENGQIVGSAMDADTKFKEVVENAVKELYEVVTQDFTTTETCSSTIRLDKNKLEDKLKVKFNE